MKTGPAPVGHDQAPVARPLAGGQPSSELVAALRTVPGLTAACCDVLDDLGLRLAVPGSVLQPLRREDVVIGRALTIRYVPSRLQSGTGTLAHFTALSLGRPGDVLVVAAPRGTEASVLGGQAARALREAGLAGVIADGYIRDVDEVDDSGLAVWCRGWVPVTGRGRLDVAEINGTLEAGGITICAGDIIVADRTGVVAIPGDAFEAVAARVLAAQSRDVDPPQ